MVKEEFLAALLAYKASHSADTLLHDVEKLLERVKIPGLVSYNDSGYIIQPTRYVLDRLQLEGMNKGCFAISADLSFAVCYEYIAERNQNHGLQKIYPNRFICMLTIFHGLLALPDRLRDSRYGGMLDYLCEMSVDFLENDCTVNIGSGVLRAAEPANE